MTPLVVAARVVRDPQDHQLSLIARKPAAGHQRGREPQPATEEAAMTGECGEDVRGIASGGEARELDNPEVDPSDLSTGARTDAWTLTSHHRETVADIVNRSRSTSARREAQPQPSDFARLQESARPLWVGLIGHDVAMVLLPTLFVASVDRSSKGCGRR